MIEIRDNILEFSFPEVHPSARLKVSFQRTLRIPDDGKDYPLPAGLREFPLSHVDDFSAKIPPAWTKHGGVMLPMYQAEAMWLKFSPKHDNERKTDYPFAVKIATGKINAISGLPWTGKLNAKPRQNYIVTTRQPWLDGYSVGDGRIRQFVAMPLGAGYTTEEQVTGKSECGGLQIMVFPMKLSAFNARFPKPRRYSGRVSCDMVYESRAEYDMGLAPGGSLRQDVAADPFKLRDWDTGHASRCFVHIANSSLWHEITGQQPPPTPPTAKDYTGAHLPWFEWYDDRNVAISGSDTLSRMKSVAQLGTEEKDVPLPEDESVTPANVIALRQGQKPGQAREFRE